MDVGNDIFAESEVELSLTNDFLIKQTFSNVIDTAFVYLPLGTLTIATTYFVRYRQRGQVLGWSEWSDVVSFTTRLTYWTGNERQELTRLNPPENIVTSGNYNSIATNAAGTTMVVGIDYAYLYGGTERVGAIIIYELVNGLWMQTKMLQEPRQLVEGQLEHHVAYGGQVAMSADGQTIVVGALVGDTSSSGQRGKFYVYKTVEFDNYDTMVLKAIVSPSYNAPSGYFPNSLKISGDGSTIIASQTNAGDHWGVYVYSFDGTIVTEITRIEETLVKLGDCVSINYDGTRFIASRMYEGLDGQLAVYEFNGTTWTQSDIIEPSGDASNHFSYQCTINSDGNTIAAADDIGQFFIFEYNGTNWVKTQKITEPEWQDGLLGGTPTSFAINAAGTLLLVGSSMQSIPANVGTEYAWSNTGAAYLYEKVNNVWEQKHIFYASDYEPTSYFGWDIKMSDNGGVIFIAAAYQFWVSNQPLAGAVYIFA